MAGESGHLGRALWEWGRKVHRKVSRCVSLFDAEITGIIGS